MSGLKEMGDKGLVVDNDDVLAVEQLRKEKGLSRKHSLSGRFRL